MLNNKCVYDVVHFKVLIIQLLCLISVNVFIKHFSVTSANKNLHEFTKNKTAIPYPTHFIDNANYNDNKLSWSRNRFFHFLPKIHEGFHMRT